MTTETNELHTAIAKMQVLMTQAADRLAHYVDSLAESHTKDGIVQDVAVQLILESEADLIDALRAAALPCDQRHKSTERPPSRAHQFPAEQVAAVRADLQGALQAHGFAQMPAPPELQAQQDHVGEWVGSRSSSNDPKRIAWRPGYVVNAQVGDKIYAASPTPAPGIDYKALYEQMCERCDTLDKALGEYERAQPALEAIYQLQIGDGSWIDQTKISYDYNVRHDQSNVRIVYTITPATPVQQDPSGLGCSGPLCGLPEHGGNHHPLCKQVAQGSIQHLKTMMEHSAWEGRLELSDALANIDEFYTATPAAPVPPEQLLALLQTASQELDKLIKIFDMAQPAPVKGCQHKRYSVDAREGTGTCHDCGAEGRMQFVVGDAPSIDRVRELECVIADLKAECKELRAAQPVPAISAGPITPEMANWSKAHNEKMVKIFEKNFIAEPDKGPQ